MNGKRSWLGWIAIGLSGLALLFALFGSGFGRQGVVAGMNGGNGSQGYTQQAPGQTGRESQAAPGANTQPWMGQQGRGAQGGQVGPDANAQPRAGRSGNGQQGGRQGGPVGPGVHAQRGPEQAGDRGFGFGSWFRFPFMLIGGAFRAAMVVLLIGAGLWLLGGRKVGGTTGGMQTAPAQAPSQGTVSPTGETYSDEQPS